MSSAQVVTDNWNEYILYYVNVAGDSAIYNVDLSNVCDYGYDGSNQTYIIDWYLTTVSEPTRTTLESYSYITVHSFFTNTYTYPSTVLQYQQYAKMPTSVLSALSLGGYPSGTFTDAIVFDTTTKTFKYYDGSAWVTI